MLKCLKEDFFFINRKFSLFFPLKYFFDFFKKECEKVHNKFLKVEIKKMVEKSVVYVKLRNQTEKICFNTMLKVINKGC